ncbi:hypothetical protein T484DRAFT_1741037 [Baffinella frigidus]|nr:hypothetical protein T484DRAFT_1741037 [Cryptophyta sp. CCMP2293]
MEALNAMMQRLGRTDPRLAEEMRLQQEENRRRDEETRLRSHFGAAGRPTAGSCIPDTTPKLAPPPEANFGFTLRHTPPPLGMPMNVWFGHGTNCIAQRETGPAHASRPGANPQTLNPKP